MQTTAFNPNLPWWDIFDSNDRLFNTVRAADENDACMRSDRQAFLIGIGITPRFLSRGNPSGAYAKLTPSGGIHPF